MFSKHAIVSGFARGENAALPLKKRWYAAACTSFFLGKISGHDLDEPWGSSPRRSVTQGKKILSRQHNSTNTYLSETPYPRPGISRSCVPRALTIVPSALLSANALSTISEKALAKHNRIFRILKDPLEMSLSIVLTACAECKRKKEGHAETLGTY
jgi:hypothetical protein